MWRNIMVLGVWLIIFMSALTKNKHDKIYRILLAMLLAYLAVNFM